MRSSRLRWVVLCTAALVALGLVHASRSAAATGSLAEMNQRIAARFPEVPTISVETLAQWMEGRGAAAPLVLDVRAQDEFEVSHLPTAQWAGTERRQRALLEQSSPGQPVVLYCSVGWRSAEATKRLLKAGHPVFNLRGSIFEWAHEGHPLTDGTRAVQVVHPYDRTWGQLLERRFWPAAWASP